MSREQRIVEAFRSLTDSVASDVDPLVLLRRLVAHSTALTGADAAGVMLTTVHGGLRTMALSDDRAPVVAVFRSQRRTGPCPDCRRSGRPVDVTDPAAAAQRWPGFAPLAATAGFAAAHALPIRGHGQTIGVLHVLMREAGPLPTAELHLLQALADLSGTAVLQWRAEPLRLVDILARVQSAVSAKATVDVAVGMIAAAGTLPLPQAARALHVYADRHGERPTDTAAALVRRDLRPQKVLQGFQEVPRAGS
ncbi:GAF domain-containing protein [Streptomyces sp. NPDC059785]|uniref:GAF domain-containing protein n=1 Tax=unclassified Streptomyces TaxID=2593676 RepID=UPI0036669017